MEHPIFTYDQYYEENGEAVANGLASVSYSRWVDHKVHVKNMFDQIIRMKQREQEAAEIAS